MQTQMRCGMRNGLSTRLVPVPVNKSSPAVVIRRKQLQVLAGANTNPTGTTTLPRSEEARKYFRSVYDFAAWQKHRSNTRYFSRLALIFQSHILQNVTPAVGWVMFVSACVASYSSALDAHLLPDALPSLNPNTACTTFISQTSVALSLLLVFRTNSSYGRWDEARKMWGGLLNRSRDIMRQAATCFPDDSPEAKQALARWTIAYARALRIHFQPEVTLENELEKILKPEELAMLASAQHRPVRAIHAISHIIQSVPMSPIHQMQMSTNLTFFHDVLGGCERLLRAPIPVSYTRHTARFLFVWLTLLPFALYPSTGWAVIPLAGGIAAVLCGIEEIGVQCEEPFGILPLDVICGRIESDVRATLMDDNATKDILNASIYNIGPLSKNALPAAVPAALPAAAAAPAPVPATASASNGNGNGNGKMLVTDSPNEIKINVVVGSN